MVIARLTSSGIINDWMSRMINKLNYFYMNNFFSLKSILSGPVSLGVQHVQGAFILLVIGLCTSSIVFVIEIMNNNILLRKLSLFRMYFSIQKK